MSLNLLEDTRSQVELDKVITTFLLKEKAKEQIWKGGCWLRAGLGSAEVLFLIPHHTGPNSKRNRFPLLSKTGLFGGFFLQGSFPSGGGGGFHCSSARDTGMQEGR